MEYPWNGLKEKMPRPIPRASHSVLGIHAQESAFLISLSDSDAGWL
jgi:hypothetical protein